MKILLLDIETSPNLAYTWGLYQQNISLSQIVEPGSTLCWAAKWLGKKEVIFKSVYEDSFGKMMHAAWKLLNEADVIVHYNGAKFDVPTMNREFVLQGWKPPSSYQQIDLLKVARKHFRFSSNKLDFISQQLGLGSKTQHKGMELWTDCMNGDMDAWKIMKRYNIQDVRLLEKLYKHLLPWITNHPNRGVYDEAPVCPNCGSYNLTKNGFQYTRTGKYQEYRCGGCGSYPSGKTNLIDLEVRKRLLK